MKFQCLCFMLLFCSYPMVFCQLNDPRCSFSKRKVTIGAQVTLECTSNQIVSTLTLTKDSNILRSYAFAKSVLYDHVVTEEDHNSRFTCIQTSLVDGTIRSCSIRLKVYVPVVEIKQSSQAFVGSNITLTCTGTDTLGVYQNTSWDIPIYFLHPTLRAVEDKKRTHALQLFNIEENDDQVEISCSLKTTAGMWNASRTLEISSIIDVNMNDITTPTYDLKTTLPYDGGMFTTFERVSALDSGSQRTMVKQSNAGKHNSTTEITTDSTEGFQLPIFWVMFICATTGFTVSFCSVYCMIRCICASKHRSGDGHSTWVFKRCTDHSNHYATTIPRSEHGSFTANKTHGVNNFYITCANDINGYDTIKCNEYLEPIIRPLIRESISSCEEIQTLKCQESPGAEIQLNIGDYHGNNEYLEPIRHKHLKDKSVTDTVYSVPFSE